MKASICGALFACLVIAGACSSDEVKGGGTAEGCVINTDCAAPLVCAFSKCHVACTTSRDCDLGQNCVASDRPFHVCQLDVEKNCSHNSDCPVGQACGVDLQCRDQCIADRDCVKEQLCVGGTCAGVNELQDGGLASVIVEAGLPQSGQRCLYNSECTAPLVCRNNLCSNECITRADCSADRDCIDNRCVAVSGTEIGSAGGVVTVGSVTLTIPAGSLQDPTSISILPLEAWPAGALGPVFQIEPTGLQFNPSATLTYKYASADIGSASPTALQLATATGSHWTGMMSTIDAAAQTVSAKIAHLSIYGVIDSSAKDAGTTATSDDAGRSNTDAGGSLGGDGGTSPPMLDASLLISCPTSCTAADSCSCQTVGNCGGHAYGVSCTASSCTCSMDNENGKIFDQNTCDDTLLTNPKSCGFPFTGRPAPL